MKQFPSTELRTKTTNVYNEVLQEGIAKIIHRDRPDMFLMSEKYLLEITKQYYGHGKFRAEEE